MIPLPWSLLGLITILNGQEAPLSTGGREPIPALEAWSLDRMREMGIALAAQDRAAIVAGERLRRSFDNADPPGLIGWIAIPDGEAQRIRFLVDRAGEPRIGWDVVVTRRQAGQLIIPSDDRLSPDEHAQFRARRTAAANVGPEACGRYNVFALKDPDSQDWLVWLLANANDARTVPMDGHFRFRISADGSRMLRRDRLSRSCSRHPRSPGTVQKILYMAGGTPPSEAIAYVSIMNGFQIAVENSPTTFIVFNGTEVEEVTPRRSRPRRQRF